MQFAWCNMTMCFRYSGFHLDPELASAVGTRARPGREERAERQGGSFLSSPQAATGRSQNLKILISNGVAGNLGL
jgi:hypothetical protein